jgi:hypothetical protein
LNGVGNTLDDNGVVRTVGAVEQLPSSLEVSANANSSSDSDLVGGKWVFFFVNSSVSV